MKKILLFIAILMNTLSSYSLDTKWLEDFEKGDFDKCHSFVLLNALSDEDREIIKNKVDQAIQKIKAEHKPIFCKTVDNDLLLFGGLQLSSILGGFTLIMTGGFSWIILRELRQESIKYDQKVNSEDLGGANCVARLAYVDLYNKVTQRFSHTSKFCIGITLITSLFGIGCYKFWRKYQDISSKVIQLRFLNNIKEALEAPNSQF